MGLIWASCNCCVLGTFFACCATVAKYNYISYSSLLTLLHNFPLEAGEIKELQCLMVLGDDDVLNIEIVIYFIKFNVFILCPICLNGISIMISLLLLIYFFQSMN